MTLEETKKKAKKMLEYYYAEVNREEEKFEYERGHISEDNAIDIIQEFLNYIEHESISKEKVRKLYVDYLERIRYIDDNNFVQDDIYHKYIAICDVLQKLLGEE